MRHYIAALGLGLLSATGLPLLANAADMAPPPVLRGPLPATESSSNWDGFYIGASGGFGSISRSSQPSQGVTNPLLRALVRGSEVEPGVMAMPIIEKGRTQSQRVSFGAFAGYNVMMEDFVIGAEVDYNRGRLDVESSGSRSGRTSGAATIYDWNGSTKTSVRISDFGSVRGRVGYTMGSWMPYVSAGLAFARLAEKNYAAIQGTQCPFVTAGICASPMAPTLYNPAELGDSNGNKLVFGYALGAGVDMMLSNNIILRAEVQHLRFAPNNGMSVQLNHAKIGAAIKY
jgi:outer membrane immunogenic protein